METQKNTKLQEIKEQERIDLNNIHLALWNPRFEIIDSLNFDFVSVFKKEDKNWNQNKELDTIIKLYSEDKDAFEELFDSINNEFFAENENIQLIYNEESDNYIVIEGNRRVSCLKILQNIDEYVKELKKFEDSFFASLSVQQKTNFLAFLKNKLKENLNAKIKFLSKKEYKIFENNASISNSLFKKHIAGDMVGYKTWNKAKYYLDLFSIFRTENWLFRDDIKNNEKEVTKRFNKNSSQLFRDYKNACWFVQLFSDVEERDIDKIKDDILHIKPSAFEISFIKSTFNFCINIIGTEKFSKTNLDKYLDLDFVETNRKWINKGSFNLDKIIKFVLSLKRENLQTTRKDKFESEENREKLIKLFLKYFDSEEFVNSNKQFIDDFSSFNLVQLKALYERNWFINHENKKEISYLLKQRIEQLEETAAIIKDFKTQKVDSILELSNQMLHNSSFNKFYINAIHSSLRTICEYIIKLIILQALENISKTELRNKQEFEYEYEEEKEFYKIFGDDIEEIDFKSLEEREKITIALLTDFESNEDKTILYKRIFKNIMKIKRREKMFSNKIFKDAFKSFFNDHYQVTELEDFIKNYYSTINVFIHKVYIKDFANTTKIFSEVIKQNNKVLREFHKIVKNLRPEYINWYVAEINKAAKMEEKTDIILREVF